MILVIRFYMPDLDLYRIQLDQIWNAGQLTYGPLVLRLREALKNFLGVQNLQPMANGMLELQFATKTPDLDGEIVQPSTVIVHRYPQLLPECSDGAGLVKIDNFLRNPSKMGFVYLLAGMGVEETARMTVRLLRHKFTSLMCLRRRSNEYNWKLETTQRIGPNHLVRTIGIKET